MTSASYDRLFAGYYNAGLKSLANPGGLSGTGAVRANWEPMLTDFVTVAGEAAASAAAAAASANVAVNAPGTTATSATNIAIGTGAKTITINTGKTIVPGMPLMVARTADPANSFMWGICTAYNSVSGQLDWLVSGIGPTVGTFNAWTVSVAGPPLNMTTDVFNVVKSLKLTGVITPTIAADQNDWNPAGLTDATTISVQATGADRTVTGLQGGASGRIVRIENIGATYAIILTYQGGASLAANRFYFGGASDVILAPGQSLTLFYSGIAGGCWAPLSGTLRAAPADIRKNLNFCSAMSPGDFWASQAAVAVAYNSTITLDLSAGFNFTTTVTGGPTLANPTNAKVGQEFVWELTNGAGAGQPTFGSNWKRPGGAPVFDTTNGHKNIIVAKVSPSGLIIWDLKRNPT